MSKILIVDFPGMVVGWYGARHSSSPFMGLNVVVGVIVLCVMVLNGYKGFRNCVNHVNRKDVAGPMCAPTPEAAGVRRNQPPWAIGPRLAGGECGAGCHRCDLSSMTKWNIQSIGSIYFSSHCHTGRFDLLSQRHRSRVGGVYGTCRRATGCSTTPRRSTI